MKTLEILGKYQQMSAEPDNMTDWQAILWHTSGLIRLAKRIRGTERKTIRKIRTPMFKQEELF